MNGDIERELEQLPLEVIDGAWKSLCTTIIIQSLARLERNASKASQKNTSINADYTLQGETAEKWIEGGLGVVTLEDCCEATGLDPDNVRKTCRDRAKQRSLQPHKFRRVTRPRPRLL
jgi:hypothetical protein